ncbi:MAG: excinuclease ABC subunit UvrC [Thermodesulfobacterium sp.]|nr:excinuclease ABC subunit UvrC [Thermodesulfobacterium sp.]
MNIPLSQLELEKIPNEPGVYLYKDARGDVLYVGKAKDLRARISSYFRNGYLSPKIQRLLDTAKELEYILTRTEKEALLLEATLIKKYRPKYNVLLKDDKNYPLIRINLNEEYPALQIVRKRKKGDKALYFGPFTSAKAIREILKLLSKTFPLRRCTLAEMKRRRAPCVYYQIKKCLAPCVRDVPREEYAKLVQGVVDFFQGRARELLDKMKAEMLELAERLEFERAAFLRDRIKELEEVLNKQAVVLSTPEDFDLWHAKLEDEDLYLIVLFVRFGYLYGFQPFRLKKPIEEEGTLKSLIIQYYSEGKVIPDKVYLSWQEENREELALALSDLAGREVIVSPLPKGDEYSYLLEIAQKNLEHFRLSQLRKEKPWHDGLAEELARLLRMPDLPRFVEAVDLSQYAGTARVGAIVCFFEGEPDKTRYRHYHIKSEGRDDYSMLYEVVYRRLRRGLEEGNLPDVLLIDGGKGHLQTALQAAEDLGITEIALAGVAKNEKRAPEKLYLPGRKNPVFLPKHERVYHFIWRVMEEAHRFAKSFAEKTKERLDFSSELLDSIPGLGPKRKKTLLSHFSSLDELSQASLEEIARLPGFNLSLAKRIKERLTTNEQK